MGIKIKNKKILITQNSLARIAGSEIVTLELATYLKDNGADVAVFTWYTGAPIIDEFSKRGIKVTTDDWDEESFRDVDYVWVNHQVIPLWLLQKIGEPPKKKLPIFIYLHMSAYKDLFLEQPYVYDLENKIASKILYVSDEVKGMMSEKGFFANDSRNDFFRNPAPLGYAIDNRRSVSLKKLLIVSNHITDEIDGVVKILEKEGVKVNIFGSSNEYKLVSPEIINKYDAVITIGKTVQYCLVMGKPVYIYDIFGGCGYVNGKNYKTARKLNFSGRGFSKKTAELIAKELLEDYSKTIEFQEKNLAQFRDDFLIDKCFSDATNNIKPVEYNKLGKNYLNYISMAMSLMRQKVELEFSVTEYDKVTKKLIENNEALHAELNGARAENNAVRMELDTLRVDYNNIKESKTFKIVKKLADAKYDVKKIGQKLKNSSRASKLKQVKIAKKYGLKLYKIADDQLFFIRGDFVTDKKIELAVLTRVRNEELLLPDTLDYFASISKYIFAYDDMSTDGTFELLCKDNNVKIIIENLDWRSHREAEETRSRGNILEEAKKYGKIEWFFYADADERLTDFDKDLLMGLDDEVDGIKCRLFDAYMVKGDNSYQPGEKLLNFRKMYGPEYRDILMFFRNKPQIFYQGLDAREPIGIKNAITKFYCQHYGKSISVEQWEETCRYYYEHFEGRYRKKWKDRMGKAIHTKSDFGEKLYKWGDDLFSHEKLLNK